MIQKYKLLNKNNGDILLQKIQEVNIDKFNLIKNYDFKKSNIISCSINNTEYTKLKYKSILNYIYELIDDGVRIIKHTILNIKTIEKEDEGFII